MMPEQLQSASRQYRHNNKDGFVRGFDWNETIQVFELLEDRLKVALWGQEEQQKEIKRLNNEIEDMRNDTW